MENTFLRKVTINQVLPAKDICLMNQEIRGTRVCYHQMKKGEQKTCKPWGNGISILILCRGKVSFDNAEKHFDGTRKSVFVGHPDTDTLITCREEAGILELIRYLSGPERQQLSQSRDFPYFRVCDEAQRYLEEGKSEKTISRMLIPQRLIPRFAMGSVESHDEDMIKKHSHPMLEQYFFSFEDNNCSILINDGRYPYGGNTLLHIPLGSDHGILSEQGQSIHYIWMDFLFGDDGLTYMDEVHHMIE
ncbi:MAG: hypothetical protein ENTB_02069 [Enterocloster aldenensis]